jgi:hypothetical protein
MPHKIENPHLLIGEPTGSGKSILSRELIYSALLRSNRLMHRQPKGGYIVQVWYGKGYYPESLR